MRRSKTFAAALLASGATVLPLGATAGAAPAQDPLTSTACGTLGMLSQPLCQVVQEVEGLLDPADPVVEPVVEAVQPVLDALVPGTDPLAPVTDALAPVTEALAPITDALAPIAPTSPSSPTPAPTPAPGGGSAPAPTPAPGSSATGGGTKATSVGAPTGFSAPLSNGASGTRRASAPSAPSGFSLQLSPLGVPTVSIGSDFAAPALEGDLPLPEAGPFEPVIEAVRAGATSSDESKATVAILALAALGLAAGMLIDQVRKSKAPFTIG